MKTDFNAMPNPGRLDQIDKAVKAAVIINTSSGSAYDAGDEITDIFRRCGFAAPDVLCAPSEGLADILKRVKEKAYGLIVTFGGDGTANAGAKLANSLSAVFVPLPGGTMNMLSKALYGSDDWKECLRIALQTIRPRLIDVGRVEDEIFLVAAIIGRPVKLQEAREAARDKDIPQAAILAKEALDIIHKGDPVYYTLSCDGDGDGDGDTDMKPANAIMLSCPNMTAKAAKAGRFEYVATDAMRSMDLIALGWNALVSDWRQSKQITCGYTASAQFPQAEPINALLDGEQFTFQGPLSVQIEPEYLQVLAPQPSQNGKDI